jgi:ribosomal subunit interface protein
MEIKIVGNNFDLGNSLRAHTQESLNTHVKKYFPDALSARVSVSRQGRMFHTDIIINEGVNHGLFIKSTARDDEVYASVDSAISKVCTKLRRYKRKLKDHKPVAGIDFKTYLHEYNQEDTAKSIAVEEENIKIKRLSVEDAAMYLDLMSVPVLIFVNIETHKLCMIYKKENGKLVLVNTDQEIVM